jgi:hypothetical protein
VGGQHGTVSAEAAASSSCGKAAGACCGSTRPAPQALCGPCPGERQPRHRKAGSAPRMRPGRSSPQPPSTSLSPCWEAPGGWWA